MLGSISDEQFAQLAGLGRKITDYGADKQASAGGNSIEVVTVLLWLLVDEGIDETYGVAVVFNEEEEQVGEGERERESYLKCLICRSHNLIKVWQERREKNKKKLKGWKLNLKGLFILM